MVFFNTDRQTRRRTDTQTPYKMNHPIFSTSLKTFCLDKFPFSKLFKFLIVIDLRVSSLQKYHELQAIDKIKPIHLISSLFQKGIIFSYKK